MKKNPVFIVFLVILVVLAAYLVIVNLVLHGRGLKKPSGLRLKQPTEQTGN
jgi:hypothetical protein